jgi:lipopolysaccharide export system permease protein
LGFAKLLTFNRAAPRLSPVYADCPNGRKNVLIIQRYLFREVSQAFAAVLVVLLLVFLSHRFVGFLTEAAAGHIASDLIFMLLALQVAVKLSVLLPLALFVGVLLGLGRLHKDSEIVAMAAGGVGVAGLTRHIFVFAGAIGILTFVLAVFLEPRLSLVQEQVVARARGQAEVTGVVPGRFKELGEEGQVIYVQSLSDDQREMRNVFVQLNRNEQQQILVSEKAYQTVMGTSGDRFVVLEHGYRYEGQPGRADYIVTRFEKHAVRIDRIGRSEVRNRLEAKSTRELISDARPDHLAELQWRLSMPISALLLGALAVPLARTSPRQGRYAKLLLGIVVYFAYSNSLGIARKYVESGELHPWIGVWPVHIVLLTVTAWLLLSPARRRDFWLGARALFTRRDRQTKAANPALSDTPNDKASKP